MVALSGWGRFLGAAFLVQTLHGQALGNQISQGWNALRTSLAESRNPSVGIQLTELVGASLVTKRISPPEEAVSVSFLGAIPVVFQPGETSGGSAWALSEAGQWELEGVLPVSEEAVSLVPLGAGTWLLESPTLFREGNRASRFAHASTDQDGWIRRGSLIRLEREGEYWFEITKGRELRPTNLGRRHLATLALAYTPVLPVPTGAVILQCATGFLIQLDASGRLVRRVPIPGLLERPEPLHNAPLILGAAAAGDGRIVLAHRDLVVARQILKTTFLKGDSRETLHASHSSSGPGGSHSSLIGSLNAAWEEEIRLLVPRAPAIHWAVFDSKDGSMHRMDPPQGAPVRLDESMSPISLTFWLDPTGACHMGTSR